MKIWQYSSLVVICLISFNLLAQADLSWENAPEIKVSGFADIYYVYDFNAPEGTERQSFLFNHNRHNEFNLNLGLIQLDIDHAKYRANFALQTGTYANDNYVAEPGLLKNIFEANIGISLNKQNSLWLDAGILPSHIGFESAISMDNMTLTRSLSAENSPYFLSGAKLTFYPNEQWEVAGMLVNGWQRIQRLEGNSMPSFGTQVNYKASEAFMLNWSTFIGTDDPDISRRMRYFNNFYGQFQLTEKLSLLSGFDFGFQQTSINSSTYDVWYTPTLIAQYDLNKTWKASLRAEYYHDESGVIIPTETDNGFQTLGLSLNLDYVPVQHIMCRLEARWLNSEDQIFEIQTTPTNQNLFIGASMAIKFLAMKKR